MNKSAIFVQHSINFSWPNSERCYHFESDFPWQKLALFWETRLDENKWGESHRLMNRVLCSACTGRHRRALQSLLCQTLLHQPCFFTQSHKGWNKNEKWRHRSAKTLHTPCHYKVTRMKQVTPTIEKHTRGKTLKRNFKKNLQALKRNPLLSVSSSLTLKHFKE